MKDPPPVVSGRSCYFSFRATAVRSRTETTPVRSPLPVRLVLDSSHLLPPSQSPFVVLLSLYTKKKAALKYISSVLQNPFSLVSATIAVDVDIIIVDRPIHPTPPPLAIFVFSFHHTSPLSLSYTFYTYIFETSCDNGSGLTALDVRLGER